MRGARTSSRWERTGFGRRTQDSGWTVSSGAYRDRMRGLAGRGVLAAGLLVGAADSAAARPTLWDVARDPGVRVVEVRRVAAERILTREINSPQALLSAQRAAAELFSRLSGDGAALEADTGLLALLVGLIYSQPYVVDSVAARRWFERALTGELPPPLTAVALARLGDALFAVGDMAEAAADGRYYCLTPVLIGAWKRVS